jgi:hypothetical protein
VLVVVADISFQSTSKAKELPKQTIAAVASSLVQLPEALQLPGAFQV